MSEVSETEGYDIGVEWQEETPLDGDDEPKKLSKEGKEKDHPHSITIPNGFLARRAKSMARNPWMHFWVALILAFVFSFIGFYFGNFSVEVDNKGWQSRGTELANREAQLLLVRLNRDRLAFGTEADWVDLTTKNQPGWESDDDDDGVERRHLAPTTTVARSSVVPQPLSLGPNNRKNVRNHLPFPANDNLMNRKLQQLDTNGGGLFDGCNVTWYTNENMSDHERLWPVWKMKPGKSALDRDVIEVICDAEMETLHELQERGLCYGCDGDRCLPPFSVVLLARLIVGDTAGTLSCSELAATFAQQGGDVEDDFATCVSDIETSGFKLAEDELPTSCPFGFSATMVDIDFGPDARRIEYTSSIFLTYDDDDSRRSMYDNVGAFSNGDSSIASVAYDTQHEAFVNYLAEDSLTNDMIFALGSAAVTALAILVHTRSPWLTLVGLLQIIFSFPLAYFVYTLIGRLEFFPFLNFIGVFVVFALGADDVFVAVDKWKNSRLDIPLGSTQDVAALALPDAAGAMFLTTLTTAVAFFGTAVCPVAPLKCFAVFCGLLIVFDYVMCCVLVFPALCLYDKWLQGMTTAEGNNCCVSTCVSCCAGRKPTAKTQEDEVKRPSLIRRILLFFYKYMHLLRWPLFVAIITVFVFTVVRAASLSLPNSSDVRLLSPSIEYEQNYEWRLRLLYDALTKEGGSRGNVIWGVLPSDTGNHNDPEDWTKLVLDENFDPSSEAAQLYLRDFCNSFFALDEADSIEPDFICPMNKFESWLGDQSNATTSDGYATNCGGVSALPVPQGNFHSCIGSYQQDQLDDRILLRNGQVKVLVLPFQARVRYDSHYDDLDREWKALEAFFDTEREVAPIGVGRMYHSSEDFWWYDTNGQMLSTAYSAAAIALAAAAAVVLFSTRSFTLTIFSLITIGFVLTSTTAMLIAAGWTLGFLESVCFAILIGMSCDFVIHFGHAYSHMPGTEVDRHERTKHALIKMGPSILAAAFTTICAAVIMLFTVISFFQKFALILLYSILNATLASFVMYNVLTDCIGPSHPTYLVDALLARLFSCCCGGQKTERAEDEEATQGEKDHAEKDMANPKSFA